MTRIIGYLKRVSNFSEARQKEAARRFYYEAAPKELVDSLV
jgi:ribonucleoside-triphosphate reductase